LLPADVVPSAAAYPIEAWIRVTFQRKFFDTSEIDIVYLDPFFWRKLILLTDRFALYFRAYEGIFLTFIVYQDDKDSVVSIAESLARRGKGLGSHLRGGARGEYG
jgi:hypothetical protein